MKPRGILIAGNWKMNHLPTEAAAFVGALGSQKALFSSGKLTACIAPPYLSISDAHKAALKLDFPLHIAAQNAHWDDKGAYTGEISASMLKERGVHWVIIGHSERRQFFGETDEGARKRAGRLLEQGMRVIYCIGETRAEHESKQTRAVIERQLGAILKGAKAVDPRFLSGPLVIAYEPVWAIGTGLTATPEQAEEAHLLIRGLMKAWQGEAVALKTPILYGGSVTPENIDLLLACANIDGALVGGASLKSESFVKLLAAGARVCR